MKENTVLFDLDGTLWEVSETTYMSANQIARKYNLPFEITRERVNSGFGKTAEECARLYMPELEKEESEIIMNEILEFNNKMLFEIGGNVYKGLKETLEKLQENYNLGIVSNCADKKYIEAFLKTSNLEKYFDDYIAAGEVKVPKSKAIEIIIEKNNFQNSIYVGDTEKDYEAANGANIKFVQAKYGYGEDLKTEYYINDISELVNLVDIIK